MVSPILSSCEIQSSHHEPGREPFQNEAFISAAESRLNVDTREREGTLASQEADEFVVGRAAGRWSRDPDFQRVTVRAHIFCDAGIRLDVDREEDSVGGILHERKTHPR